jgi:hypothetical protein
MPSTAIGILKVRIVPIPEPEVAVGATTPCVTTISFETEFDSSDELVSEIREATRAITDNMSGRNLDFIDEN